MRSWFGCRVAHASPVSATVFHRRELFLPGERTSLAKFVALEQRDQHAERMRYPDLLHLVSGNLELMAIGIAKVNRMRDAMVLKVKSDSTLFQFLLRSFKILSIRAQGEMEDTHRSGLA